MVAHVTVDMKDMLRRTRRRLETVAHEFTQDLAETTVERTPVDTGFLRGSWFVSINDASVSFDGDTDPSGAQTVGRVSIGITQAQIGDTIYMLNGASYAPHVEFGTSRMAPRAFVRSTIGDAPQIAERTITRIAKV